MTHSTCSTDTGLDTKKIQRADIFRQSLHAEHGTFRDHRFSLSNSTIEHANKAANNTSIGLRDMQAVYDVDYCHSITRIKRAASIHSRASRPSPGRLGHIICWKPSDCSATAASSVTMSAHGNCQGPKTYRTFSADDHCPVCSQNIIPGTPRNGKAQIRNEEFAELDMMGRLIEMFTPACCSPGSGFCASHPSNAAADKAARSSKKATHSIKTMGSDMITPPHPALSSLSHLGRANIEVQS